MATIFHIDHIRSIKHGGKNSIENLAYTCPHCNQNKGSDIATYIGNDENAKITRFFNPRKDIWKEHFTVESGLIIGLTSIGIGTLSILQMNQVERIILRQVLIDIGEYPFENE